MIDLAIARTVCCEIETKYIVYYSVLRDIGALRTMVPDAIIVVNYHVAR